MYVGVYVRLEQAVSGLFRISRQFGVCLGCAGLLGLDRRQQALQLAPLAAQPASHICNWEVVTSMLVFSSVLHRSTQ